MTQLNIELNWVIVIHILPGCVLSLGNHNFSGTWITSHIFLFCASMKADRSTGTK